MNYTLKEIEISPLSDEINESIVSICGDIYTNNVISEIKKQIKIEETKCKNKKIIIKESFVFKWKNKMKAIIDLAESCDLNLYYSKESAGWIFKDFIVSFLGSENEINDFTSRLKNFDLQTSK